MPQQGARRSERQPHRLKREAGDPPYAQRSLAGVLGARPLTLPSSAWPPRRGGAAARRATAAHGSQQRLTAPR